MLSMVGGALKRINGVNDPNKLSSQGPVNEKDSVLQYQPTPIHVLKAKSTGSSCEYDPVSNFSASSSSRVTLPSCTKRSHSSDAVVPAKRLKIDVGEIEAKFSDTDDEQAVSQTSISTFSSIRVARNTVPAKSSEGSSLSTKQPPLKLPKSSHNSPSKLPCTNKPTSTAATKLSPMLSQQKDSSKSSSLSESQANVTVSSNRLELGKMPSTVSTKDDDSGKQQSSKSKAVAIGDKKQQSHNDDSRSSEGSSKCHYKNSTTNHTNSGKNSNTKHHHNKADSHHNSQPVNITGRKPNDKDSHKHVGSSNQTKSDHVHSSENSCSILARESETHRHSTNPSVKHGHKHVGSSTGIKSDHVHSSDNSCSVLARESDAHRHSTNPSVKHGHKHVGSSTGTKSDHVHSSENSCSILAGESKALGHSSNTEHRECRTHDKSEQSHKIAAMPSSHAEKQKETLPVETSMHKQKSKTDSSSGSSFCKQISSHGHDKEHKTSRHIDGEHKKSASVVNSHHSVLDPGSHKEPHQSKSAAAASGKECKTSHHKHRDSANRKHAQLVSRSPAESRHATSAMSVSGTVADTQHVNAVKNIELFGEDSDTESALQQLSSVSAQMPVKRRERVHSKPSVSSPASPSSDDVILLPTDNLSDESDNDDTFEQCQQLYNELARQQQSRPATCSSSSSSQNVSSLLSFQLYLLLPPGMFTLTLFFLCLSLFLSLMPYQMIGSCVFIDSQFADTVVWVFSVLYFLVHICILYVYVTLVYQRNIIYININFVRCPCNVFDVIVSP